MLSLGSFSVVVFLETDFHLSDSRDLAFHTSGCKLHISNSRFHITDFRFQISDEISNYVFHHISELVRISRSFGGGGEGV